MTRDELRSAYNFGGWARLLPGDDDDLIDQADQQHVLWLFRGILAAEGAPGRNTRATLVLRPAPRATLVKTGA